jgi:hypothetical protein
MSQSRLAIQPVHERWNESGRTRLSRGKYILHFRQICQSTAVNHGAARVLRASCRGAGSKPGCPAEYGPPGNPDLAGAGGAYRSGDRGRGRRADGDV